MKRAYFLPLLLVPLVAACVPLKGTPPAPCTISGAEMLAEVNADRKAAGVPPLSWAPNLASQAQAWAEHMAATGRVYHSPQPGENVVGNWPCATAAQLEDAWMASPEHRFNILMEHYRYFGFGYTVNGAGLFAVQQFA